MIITLSRHIELLLLSHDCVIVPGLGGFISNRVEAAYSQQDDKLFIPPHRTIGFNQELQINDGLLVQSYMAVYDTSYPNAYLQMEKEIDQIIQQLNIAGIAVLENIGTLRKSISGNISFETPEAGALTPDLYGLYSFEIKSLEEVIHEKEIARSFTGLGGIDVETEGKTKISVVKGEETTDATSHITGNEVRKDSELTIPLRKHWLDIAISAAAAVLLFFCFSYPAMKNTNNVNDTCVAAFYPAPEEKAKVNVKDDAENTKTQIVEGKTATDLETITQIKDNKEIIDNNKDNDKNIANDKPFSLVLASCVNKANAESFIKHLQEAGFPEARYVESEGKFNRVLYSDYATAEEARLALKELRSKNANFASAWILEK